MTAHLLWHHEQKQLYPLLTWGCKIEQAGTGAAKRANLSSSIHSLVKGSERFAASPSSCRPKPRPPLGPHRGGRRPPRCSPHVTASALRATSGSGTGASRTKISRVHTPSSVPCHQVQFRGPGDADNPTHLHQAHSAGPTTRQPCDSKL
ncbi:hypothetical protein BS78_01G245900 [Paspalum vaginatum]|nr:hypothetical protein BS78_01G245900 [Paspalum vaginatum]